MASTSEQSSSVGMPQLDFSNFDNQTFWLLVFLPPVGLPRAGESDPAMAQLHLCLGFSSIPQ